MGRQYNNLPSNPRQAERMLLRMVTDAYSVSPAWSGDGDERARIERDIRNVQTPDALGMSPEFAHWERIATRGGVIWHVSNDGWVTVEH